MYAYYWRTIPNTQVVNFPCKCDGKSKQNYILTFASFALASAFFCYCDF